MQSKASTISSGARAAAQTLNVPIERLEAQVHSSGKPSPTSPVPSHINNEKLQRYHNDEIIPNHLDYNGKSQQHVYLHQQQEIAMKNHHLNNVAVPKNGFMNGNGIVGADIDTIMQQDDMEENSSTLAPSPANAKYTLLQFALQHFRDE